VSNEGLTYAHNEELIRRMARNVAEYRKLKGYTQLELANEADVGLAQIKRIELAGVNTSISTAFRIAQALDRSVDDLLRPFDETIRLIEEENAE
jgi:transcriptional regulator with XRE-family HTH domain